MSRLALQVPRQRASSLGGATSGPQVRFDLADAVLLVLLLLSSIQFLKIGGAQLGQLFAVLVLPVLLVRRLMLVGAWVFWAFSLLVGVALLNTR